MKIYVCCITRGEYDEAYTYPIIAFSDEQKAQEWVAKKDEGLNRLWSFKEDYIQNVPFADHWLVHRIPPRNEQETIAMKKFYQVQREIITEFGISEDEHGPYYEAVDLIET